MDVGFVFFRQETAYEMRISDWSSDVSIPIWRASLHRLQASCPTLGWQCCAGVAWSLSSEPAQEPVPPAGLRVGMRCSGVVYQCIDEHDEVRGLKLQTVEVAAPLALLVDHVCHRSQAHTSELTSLMSKSYA